MVKYKINFEVKDIGPVAFDVTKETFDVISKLCKSNFPEYDWQVTNQ